MDERDLLVAALDKLAPEQVRMLAHFAEIIVADQKADPIHDTTDARARYDQFKKWCAANSIDLAGVEIWIQESRRVAPTAAR